MFKALILLAILMIGSAHASPVDQMISIKERLRLSLWVNGLDDESEVKPMPQAKPRIQLPEEIERPLKKL